MSKTLRLSIIAVFVGLMSLHALNVVRAQRPPANAPRRARPQPPPRNANRPLSPEMLQLLKDWERHSGMIKKLEGKHRRYVYDKMFKVEKRSYGEFYYEAPDKGRIDISAVKIRKGAVSKIIDKDTGKPYSLQADAPEEWICDGEGIWQINVAEKTAENIPIPPESRGKNIMEGPLPFLFGMPAKKAQARYHLAFNPRQPKEKRKTEIWLMIKPKLPSDAANWSSAKVVLDRATYLPNEVQMVDTSGNLITVYVFSKRKVNQNSILPWNNPFKPNLRGYAILPRNGGAAEPGKGKPMLPVLIGMNGQKAQSTLKKLGYKVEFVRGVPAANPTLEYVVSAQVPRAGTPFAKGQTVRVTLFDVFPN